MVSVAESQVEVDLNYEAFQGLLPELMRDHAGRWALMRDRAVVETFDTYRDACVVARMLYPDVPFSVQEIAQTPSSYLLCQLASGCCASKPRVDILTTPPPRLLV